MKKVTSKIALNILHDIVSEVELKDVNEELWTFMYKVIHIATNDCGNFHQDWHDEIIKKYEANKKRQYNISNK